MGCDIHAYIEYSNWDSGDQPYWQCFAAGFGNRDYDMFGHLAGVRSGAEPVVEPRGLPDGHVSYLVEDAMFMRVTENDALIENGQGWCSPSSAESWGVTKRDADGKPTQAMHPDMHTHGWLTRAELAQVIAAYMFDGKDRVYGVEWDAALAAMTAFEERGVKTRLVFAFDN